MNSSEFTIVLPCSLSGRNVNKIVQTANSLKSFVYLEKGSRSINMKSILGILSSNCIVGDEIRILCLNNDENIAKSDCEEMERLFKSGEL